MGINAECSFTVTVLDPCTDVVCPASECFASNTCSDGQCVPDFAADGAGCETDGVCVGGACTRPCAGFVCDEDGGACEEDGGCQIGADGVTPECVGPVPRADGAFGSATCNAGVDVCDNRHRFFGRKPPRPVRHAPAALSVAEAEALTTPAPATPAPTTAPPTTTSTPAATTDDGNRGPLEPDVMTTFEPLSFQPSTTTAAQTTTTAATAAATPTAGTTTTMPVAATTVSSAAPASTGAQTTITTFQGQLSSPNTGGSQRMLTVRTTGLVHFFFGPAPPSRQTHVHRTHALPRTHFHFLLMVAMCNLKRSR